MKLVVQIQVADVSMPGCTPLMIVLKPYLSYWGQRSSEIHSSDLFEYATNGARTKPLSFDPTLRKPITAILRDDARRET